MRGFNASVGNEYYDYHDGFFFVAVWPNSLPAKQILRIRGTNACFAPKFTLWTKLTTFQRQNEHLFYNTMSRKAAIREEKKTFDLTQGNCLSYNKMRQK